MEGRTLEELYSLRAQVDDEIRKRTARATTVSQRVCANAKCSCRFFYPNGLSRAQLQAEPIVSDRILVVYKMCLEGRTYKEEHAMLVQCIAPVRSAHINVMALKHMAFLVFTSHEEATRAQRRLEDANLEVNFKCENVEQIKGSA